MNIFILIKIKKNQFFQEITRNENNNIINIIIPSKNKLRFTSSLPTKIQLLAIGLQNYQQQSSVRNFVVVIIFLFV